MANVVVTSDVFDDLNALPPAARGAVADFLKKFQATKEAPPSLVALEQASPGVWEARIDEDVRGIFFKDKNHWILLHVGLPGATATWALDRKISRNAVTGVPDVVKKAASQPPSAPKKGTKGKTSAGKTATGKGKGKGEGLLAHLSDEFLQQFGFPEALLPALKEATTNVALLDIASDKLSEEQIIWLLELALGHTPEPPQKPIEGVPGVWSIGDDHELLTAIAQPHEKWLVFLHPAQRFLVEQSPSGPTKVSGGAGTGKTVVALHRARFLARQGKSVLVTTFTRTMVRALERSLDMLCTTQERQRIHVQTLAGEVLTFARKVDKHLNYADDDHFRDALKKAASGSKYSAKFLQTEWDSVVTTQRAFSLPQYLKAKRVGRGKALSSEEKAEIWSLFDQVLASLRQQHMAPWDLLAETAAKALKENKITTPYDAVIVDEVQDLSPSMLHFALQAGKDPKLLMLVGDAGQRIYRAGFALSSVGIAVQGRSHILKVNYRTTRQIRTAAGKVLGDFVPGPEGEPEPRTGIRDLLRGVEPTLTASPSLDKERKKAVELIRSWIDSGVSHASIALFAPTNKMADDLAHMLDKQEIDNEPLKKDDALGLGVRIGTMHRAKGLEFQYVLVIGASQEHMAQLGAHEGTDPADALAADEIRRNLLYVSMTRARQVLHVSWSGQPSSFLAPLQETPAA